MNKIDCDQLTNTDQLSSFTVLSLPFPHVNWCKSTTAFKATVAILAGFSENVVATKTSYKTLEALSFCSRERA